LALGFCKGLTLSCECYGFLSSTYGFGPAEPFPMPVTILEVVVAGLASIKDSALKDATLGVLEGAGFEVTVSTSLTFPFFGIMASLINLL
jgi:hypothetical protein